MAARSGGTRSPAQYPRFVHAVANTVALPHGYTLLLWCTTMVNIERHGIPDVVSVFCLLAGACTAYAGVGRVGRSDLADERVSLERPYRAATGNFVTLATATGVCVLASFIPITFLAWLVVGFVGTAVYLLGCAAQAFLVTRHIDR